MFPCVAMVALCACTLDASDSAAASSDPPDQLVEAAAAACPAPPPTPIVYGTDGNGNPASRDCTSFVNPGESIQSAVNDKPSGAVVCVRPGDYSSQTATLNGTGVVLRSLGTATVRNVVVSGSGNTLDGFTVVGGAFNNPAIGIEFSGANQRILHNVVHGRGIVFGFRCTSCGSANLIASNTVTGVHNYGFWIQGGDGLTIEKNNVFDLFRSTANTDVDAMRFWGTNHVIRNNYFHDINEFKSARSSGGDTPHTDCFQTFQLDNLPVENIVIENNYCVRVSRQCLIAENNRVAQYQIKNVTFRGNVCETFDSQIVNLKSVEGFKFENDLLMGGVKFQVVTLTTTFSSIPIKDITVRNSILMKATSRATFYQNNNKAPLIVDDKNIEVQNSVVASDADAFQNHPNANFPAIQPSDFTGFRSIAARNRIVDHGAAEPDLCTDIDGHPRVAGAAIDIGPFEQ